MVKCTNQLFFVGRYLRFTMARGAHIWSGLVLQEVFFLGIMNHEISAISMAVKFVEHPKKTHTAREVTTSFVFSVVVIVTCMILVTIAITSYCSFISYTGWWFETFFFPYILKNNPN